MQPLESWINLGDSLEIDIPRERDYLNFSFANSTLHAGALSVVRYGHFIEATTVEDATSTL